MVIEMFHEVAFAEFMKKPKNCPPMGMDAKAAEIEFHARAADCDTIVDFDGPNERYRQRVGVMVKTVFTKREATRKEQGYELADKVVKNATVDDVAALNHRIRSNMNEAVGQTDGPSAMDELKFMAKAAAADEGGNAFSGEISRLGGIKGLLAEVAKEDEAEDEEDPDMPPLINADKRQAEGELVDDSPAAKKPKVWFDKDVKISEAVRQQLGWQVDMRKTLRELHSNTLGVMKDLLVCIIVCVASLCCQCGLDYDGHTESIWAVRVYVCEHVKA